MLADIIVHYDALDGIYAGMCNDKELPAYHRHAANRGRVTFNKYYQKSDESEMYRLAIRMCLFLRSVLIIYFRDRFIVMHPSMRMLYLTAAGWEPDWIETAVEIAERCWRNHYQPSPATEVEAHATSQYAYSKVGFLLLYLMH